MSMESTKTTTIYYFSGTGNTLKIARDLIGKLDNSELIPIAKIIHQDDIISQSKKVGIITPLYWSGLPKITFDFINKINLENSNYIFSIITCGHAGMGASLHQIKKLLKKKSKNLNAGFFVEMPDNYLPVYDPASYENPSEIFENATKKVGEIAQKLQHKASEIEKEALSSIGKIVNKLFRRKVSKSDKNFYFEHTCNSCGICEKVCPVNNILLDDGKPTWRHGCERCLACIHFCPQRAIQWKNKTKDKGRYHHPDVSLKEMMIWRKS